MTERQPAITLKQIVEGASKQCGLEGVDGRPDDCKNNPWKYPNNYRPYICRQCPSTPQIAAVAERPMPPEYIKFKQER